MTESTKAPFQFNAFQLEWLEALKSGKYTQGGEALRSPFEPNKEYEYCCLGVAVELNGDDPEDKSTLGNFVDVKSKLCVRSDLGRVEATGIDMGDWLKSRGYERLAKHRWVYLTLAGLNDNAVSFEHIAEFIETYPEAVFTSDVFTTAQEQS